MALALQLLNDYDNTEHLASDLRLILHSRWYNPPKNPHNRNTSKLVIRVSLQRMLGNRNPGLS